MKRILLIALIPVCALSTLAAQSEIQALTFSRYNPFGTARYAAQGGAIGALGGDLSAIVENPAGLGFYRSPELSFSPSLYWVNTRARFMGKVTEDSNLKLNLGSFGLVSAANRNKSNGIVGASYAIGYHTLAHFNNHTTVRGVNTNSSLLDDFTWHANADPDNLSPYYEQLAFDAFLMPYDTAAREFWHDLMLDGYGQQLYREVETSGYIGEYSLSGAMNIGNLIYLGASLGIHSVRYYENIYHVETDYEDNVLDFGSFRFREFNTTRGWGYTFRMGMIVRPLQLVRVGASFQMPTFYRLTDEKVTDIHSYWDSGSGIQDAYESSPNGIFDYELRTPYRIRAHASLILLKLATVSAGYEYVDYSSARLDAYDYKFLDQNDRIRQEFQATHHLKAGAELRLNNFYLRTGGQYILSPFSDSRNNAETWVWAGGLGLRTRTMFFDLSFSRGSRTEVYGMYAFEPGINEVSVNRMNPNNLMCTLGFRF